MADIAVNDLTLVTHVGQLCGQRVMSTFAFRCSAVVGGPHDLATVYDALFASLSTPATGLFARYLACCPDNLDAVATWIQKVYPLRYAKRIYAPILTNGTVGTDAVTANIQASITRRGELGTRESVSHLNVPAPTTSVEALVGEWEAGYKVTLNALATALPSQVNVLAGNVSFKPTIINSPQPIPWTDIAEAFIQTEVRTMRRRTVRLGI